MLLVLLLALVLPASAHAAWTAPFDVSAPGEDSAAPQVGVANSGRAFFTWYVYDGTSSTCCAIVKLRIRSAAGALGPVQDLSPPDEYNAVPQIAVNAKGDAAFLWRHGDFATLQGRVRSSGGTLGTTRLIAGPGAAHGLSGYDAGIDSSANATFVWRNFDSPGSRQCSGTDCYRVRTRRLSPGGTLGTITTLSPPRVNGTFPRLAVDEKGDVAFVWLSFAGRASPGEPCYFPRECRVQTRVRSATGTLGPLQTLSGPGAAEAQVAVDANGNATYVWTIYDATSCGEFACTRIQTRTRSASGALSPVQTLSPPGRDAFEPQVAVNRDGNAVFAWVHYDETNDCPRTFPCLRVQTRTRTKAGTLSAVQTLSTGAKSNSDYPRVGIDDNGRAVFVWRSRNLKAIRARTRSATGALSPIQTVSDLAKPSTVDVFNPLALAVNPAGTAVAGWTSVGSPGSSIAGAVGP